MISIKPKETSVAQAPSARNRREALKRFGRYAAVAPTVMILLDPSEGYAGKGKGVAWGKGGRWGGGRNGHY